MYQHSIDETILFRILQAFLRLKKTQAKPISQAEQQNQPKTQASYSKGGGITSEQDNTTAQCNTSTNKIRSCHFRQEINQMKNMVIGI
jgi:hypothetical protein